MTEKKDQVIELGGKRFVATAERSVSNDFWIMEEAGRVGLTNLHMTPGEDAHAFASRILMQAISGGAVFTLLGGLLLPEGASPEDWTPAMAQETGRFLKALTTSEDKDVVRGAVGGMLSNFFSSGLASATTSATSSPAAMAAAQGLLAQLGGLSPNVNNDKPLGAH